jgi:ribosomal protein S12 methylthiotransferase accessory factor
MNSSSVLPEYPALKRHILPVPVGASDIYLLSEDRAWMWQNEAVHRIAPLLDGSRSLGDLIVQTSEHLAPTDLVHALCELETRGLLRDGFLPDLDSRDGALADALGIGAPLDGARTPVCVTEIGRGATASLVTQALESAGIPVNSLGQGLRIVATDHYYRPELGQFNREGLASGEPWLLCKLVGQTLWLGPLFHPGRTGCFVCLQERLRLNRQVEDYAVRRSGNAELYETSGAALPATVRLGAAWLVQEILLWQAGLSDRLEGRLLTVHLGLDGPKTAWHVLSRRPQCAACGDPAQACRTGPIELRRHSVNGSSDGGFRIEAPQATLERLKRHISPITGVVTWLVELSQEPGGLIQSYSAGHNFAMGPGTPYWLMQSMRARTGGKGITSTQASVSAVCEAVERYCGVFRGDEPCLQATYRSLAEKAVHPRQFLGFSERQYERREEINRSSREGPFHLIPRQFPEDVPIDWVPLWSLTANEARYLPAAYCYSGHPDVERHFYCAGDSNGTAAGNVLEEAILQAFLEIVERDGTAIWWYNRIARPAVDFASFCVPYLDQVLEHYRNLGRELWALDLTNDLGLPIMAAVSRRVGGETDDLLIGLGAHLDAQVALLRAVTEVNQFLPAVALDSQGKTNYAWPDDVAVRFWKEETLDTQPQLRPDRSVPARTPADFPNRAAPDLYDNLQVCLQTLQRANMEMLVLDQSRPDIELSVVRVVVPGMRHFWRRLGPGRLYDVPVQLGWLSRPTPEEKLNPVSVFF